MVLGFGTSSIELNKEKFSAPPISIPKFQIIKTSEEKIPNPNKFFSITDPDSLLLTQMRIEEIRQQRKDFKVETV